jgi:beta-galactosidase/beta-glucuronidase
VIQHLSGNWRIACDPDNKGREASWFQQAQEAAQPAPVPGIIQQVFPGYHGVAWYWHTFRIIEPPKPGERVFVRFGAVDYVAEAWVNGKHAGKFEGGETPFEFDVTDLVKSGVENLLAVRVINPTDEPIDGYILDQVPHRNKVMKYFSGASFNTGGIMYPVELVVVPPVRIADLFAVPDIATGRIAVHCKLFNDRKTPVAVVVSMDVAEASGDERELAAQRQEALVLPGENALDLEVAVPQPRLWDLDDPFLYRVTVRVEAQGQAAHRRSVRCGFRDFRLVDGFFHLNGRRIFLKCSHTGNHVPIGQQLAVVKDHVRRDLFSAKASGFNALRFIAGVAWPAQLDFCDER